MKTDKEWLKQQKRFRERNIRKTRSKRRTEDERRDLIRLQCTRDKRITSVS